MGFNRLLAAGFIAVVLASGACGSAKKTAASGKNKKVKKVACALNSTDPHLTWYIEDTALMDSFRSKPPMWTGGRLFSLDSNEVKSFFALFTDSLGRKVKTVMALPLPLPAPNDCKSFQVSIPVAMNEKIRAKHKERVSLEGKAMDGKGSARIMYDGRKLMIQVKVDSLNFMLSETKHRGQTFYVMHSRPAAPDKKPSEKIGEPRNENK